MIWYRQMPGSARIRFPGAGRFVLAALLSMTGSTTGTASTEMESFPDQMHLLMQPFTFYAPNRVAFGLQDEFLSGKLDYGFSYHYSTPMDSYERGQGGHELEFRIGTSWKARYWTGVSTLQFMQVETGRERVGPDTVRVTSDIYTLRSMGGRTFYVAGYLGLGLRLMNEGFSVDWEGDQIVDGSATEIMPFAEIEMGNVFFYHSCLTRFFGWFGLNPAEIRLTARLPVVISIRSHSILNQGVYDSWANYAGNDSYDLDTRTSIRSFVADYDGTKVSLGYRLAINWGALNFGVQNFGMYGPVVFFGLVWPLRFITGPEPESKAGPKSPAVEAPPVDVAKEYESAVADYNAGDYAGCRQKASAILQAQPAHWQSWALIGNCQYKQGDTAGAMASYKRSLEINPDNAQLKAWLDQISKQ